MFQAIDSLPRITLAHISALGIGSRVSRWKSPQACLALAIDILKASVRH